MNTLCQRLRPLLLQDRARSGVVVGIMAHTAKGHRGDEAALDGLVQVGPCRLAGPVGISGKSTAVFGPGRGRPGKARENGGGRSKSRLHCSESERAEGEVGFSRRRTSDSTDGNVTVPSKT